MPKKERIENVRQFVACCVTLGIPAAAFIPPDFLEMGDVRLGDVRRGGS